MHINAKLSLSINSGNGSIQNLSYNYDVIGNQLNRINGMNQKVESFTYDVLNRLTSATVGNEVQSLQYDDIGNITYKSDVGTYSYGSVNQGPHQLQTVDWNTSDQTFTPHPEFHPKGQYTYNNQGQLLYGGQREYSWTGFDKPWRIYSKGKSVSYRYGPDYQKVMKITKPGQNLAAYANLEDDIEFNGGTNHEAIFYGGQDYSYILNPPHDKIEKYNISAGSVDIVLNINHLGHPANQQTNLKGNKGKNGVQGIGNCGIPPGHANTDSLPPSYDKHCTDEQDQNNNYPNSGNGNGPDIPPGELAKIKYKTSYRYILKDHIGSTDVILDDKGDVVQRMSFDPWGATRNSDWSYSAKVMESVAQSGFTGHEAIEPVGLIHMKGRVYDPVLGRFTSTDPYIPDVNYMQAYNRYNYVLNNPLKYTDPSGYLTTSSPIPGYNCTVVIKGKNDQHEYYNCTAPSSPPPIDPAPGATATIDADGNFSYPTVGGGVVLVVYDPGVNAFVVSYFPNTTQQALYSSSLGGLEYELLKINVDVYGGINPNDLGTNNDNKDTQVGQMGGVLTIGTDPTIMIDKIPEIVIYGLPGEVRSIEIVNDIAKSFGITELTDDNRVVLGEISKLLAAEYVTEVYRLTPTKHLPKHSVTGPSATTSQDSGPPAGTVGAGPGSGEAGDGHGTANDGSI